MDRIREAARKNRKEQFSSLWHHVYDVSQLREAYLSLNRRSAKGVDGVTWQAYEKNREANLAHLTARLQRGVYRAKPLRRPYIPKAEGRERPIGIPALEDKIVQSVEMAIQD